MHFDNSTNILVTAIGTANSTEIVHKLNEIKNANIFGADIYPQPCIATSLDVESFYQFPPVLSKSDDYFSFIFKFCIEHQIKFIFAVIDEEVILLSKNAGFLRENGIIPCVMNYDAAIVCHNKKLTNEWVRKNRNDVFIREYDADALRSSIDFPIFAKPTSGRASIGCKMISSRMELSEFIDRHESKEYIFQEYLDYPIVSVDIARDNNSDDIQMIQRRELIRNSNGCATSVEIIDDSYLNEIVVNISKGIGINGVANFEFFDLGTSYRLIEINPRFPAGTVFSCMSGLNLVEKQLKISMGLQFQYDEIRTGQFFAKRYEAYETKK